MNTPALRSRPLRIGIDARPLSYRLTGIGYYLKHLLDAMQAEDTPHRFYLISNTAIDYRLFGDRWHKVEGRMARRLTSTLWVQARVPLLARRLGLDVFWSPRHHLPLLLPPDVGCVVTIHDIVHRRYPETMSRANLMVERLLMKASIRRAGTIITDAAATRRDLGRWYAVAPSRVRVIHPGVPPLSAGGTGDAPPLENLPPKYVLFVGTLDPRKNFEGLFSAFEMLAPQRHGVHLVIVGGRGWKNSRFFERLAGSPVRHNVRLTGYLDRRQLAGVYRRAVCLVLPSVYEGFGFPILEAMSAGTPVVTSSVSSMPEVAGGAALLVDPRNTAQIAGAMSSLLHDEKLRRRLIAAGRRRAAAFSWRRCARRTLQTLEEAVVK